MSVDGKKLFALKGNVPAFLECFSNIKGVKCCEHNSMLVLFYVKGEGIMEI